MTQRRSTSVVVPAVGTAGSLHVVRSLGRSGINTIAVSEQERPPSFSSRYCGEQLAVPDPSYDLRGYRNALLDLARRQDVGTIVPVREPDIHVLSKHRSAFDDHIETLWPTFEQLRAVHDRRRLFGCADRAGVSVPDTTLLDEVDDWARERIVKGRYALLTADYVDWLSEGRCESPPKTVFLEPGVEPAIDDIVEAMGHVPVAQEYVAGDEFCLRALYRDGEVVATSQKRLIRGYKYARGPSIFHEAVDIPALEAAGLALLDELDWHGLASVGFIRDDSGAFRLLEVNPRIPSSIPVDIHASVDYPRYYWQLATRGSVEDVPEYRSGTSSHLLRGELVHLHSVLFEDYALAGRPSPVSTVRDIATSLVENPNFDYLCLDDPAPFVRDALNAGRSFFSG